MWTLIYDTIYAHQVMSERRCFSPPFLWSAWRLCVTCGRCLWFRLFLCDLALPGKQDKEDDIKVGVKSTALRFQGQTKAWLSGFAVAMMSGLLTAGINGEQTLPYYATLSTVAIHLVYQVRGPKSGPLLPQRSVVLLKDGVLMEPPPPHPPPSLTDLHVGHQQTRRLLAEICL